MVCNFRIPPPQFCRALRDVYIGFKKFGVLVKNFPLGGARRFGRSMFETFLSCKKSTVCRLLCRFVEHIRFHKLLKAKDSALS